ncbi:MAG: N-acetylneuraminate synthase family protein [Paracoccaceae bacterium]
MQLGKRKISTETSPLVVAELGINHGGCIKTAMSMVKLAAESGCECIKHQTHIVSDEMTEEAKLVYPPNAEISIWEVIDRCALSLDDEIALKNYTESLGLIYISTPFSRKAADFLDDIGICAFKIGSGEVDNIPLVNHIASFKKPIIMSTGMQNINSLTNSTKIIEKHDISYALLECTSAYPAKPETIFLRSIGELKERFPKSIVGFSDHSIGPTMAIAATALGAKIIEKHFTDSKYRKGPDIICSMDPSELRYLIDKCTEVHNALKRDKVRTTEESEVYKFARSSVVAEREIKKGHIITNDDIWTRRPGNGPIAAADYQKLLGKKAKKNILKNQQLDWSDFF